MTDIKPRPDEALVGEVQERYDTHYEVALDPEPDPTAAPIFVDAVFKDDEWRPIIPAAWRRGNIRRSIKFTAHRIGRRVGYHAVRAPHIYLPLALFWSVVGVFKVLGMEARWWWFHEQFTLRQEAATHNDPDTWLRLHREAKATRLFRGWVLIGQFVGLVVLFALLKWVFPGWASVLVLAVAVPLLAHVGRPVGKPIISPAVVRARYRKLNPDIVLFAYYAAKLGDPAKPGQKVDFLSTMAEDPNRQGSEVQVALPAGKEFSDAVKAKGSIASGLDVSINQVFLRRDKKSERSHYLYVSHEDPLAIPAGRTPLLRLKQTDIWKPAPLGLDERGNLVSLPLMWNSVLVGAQPRKGKTFTARLLALYAALDPYVQLIVVDGKNSPDWRKFALVAHRIIFGTVPNRQGDPIEMLIETLREVKRHIDEVNAFLSTLSSDECPEGKITPELSRKYKQLRPWMLVIEEFQVYYELDDKDASEEIASLLSYAMAVGPSSGVMLVDCSQKPSGVGASLNIQRLFTRFRDNHAVRIALKCGSRQVSEAILGTEAYGEGYDATTLPVGDEYRGVAILYGASDNTPTVRSHLANGKDAEKILHAARAFRERAGLLTGDAAGEEATREARDVLADTIRVFAHVGNRRIHSDRLAEQLAELKPEAYAGATKESVAALLRAEGVPIGQVKVDNENRNGVKREDVEAAVRRREIGGRAA